MNIIPSLVEATANDLFERIAYLSPYYSQFQVDIEDGIFIENKTLPIEDFISYVEKKHSVLSASLLFDFHLMEKDFEHSIQAIDKIKTLIRVDVIFVHTILRPDYNLLQKRYPSFHIGLAINPMEEIKTINDRYSLKSIPFLQLMTVNPGKQGQPFIPEVLQKIEQLKNYGFQGKIYIDGAVNDKTIPLMSTLRFKPDVLCPGSYLAKSTPDELPKRVEYLKSLTGGSTE